MAKQTNVRLSDKARSQIVKAKQVYPFLKTDTSVIEFALNQLSSLIDRNYFSEVEQAVVSVPINQASIARDKVRAHYNEAVAKELSVEYDE